MKKYFIFFVAYLLIGLTSSIFAQSDYNTSMKQVNTIKKNTNYLNATGMSSKDFNEAYENAKALLSQEIEIWLAENKVTDAAGYIAKSNNSLSKIEVQRGNVYRAFLYVKKKDILPIYKEEDIIMVGIGKSEKQDNTREIVAEVKQDNAIVQIPQNETAVKSVNLEAKVETVEPTKESIKIVEALPENTEVLSVLVLTPIEKEMLMVKKFTDVEYFIKGNHITKYGKYKDMPSTGNLHIFVYNKEGVILACLKSENGNTTNLNTGKNDDITVYKNCGAIWFEK